MKAHLRFAAAITFALTSGAAAAQDGWQPMIGPWDLGTSAMAETAMQNVIHQDIMDEQIRKAEEEERGAGLAAGGQAPPPATARQGIDTSVLAFTPSAERRRTNLAHIIDQRRAQDPQGAAAIEAAFADGAIIDQLGALMAPYGYSVANLGDAYAMWWQIAWKGAQGIVSDPTPGQMRAVQAQARQAMAATPELAQADDASKQQMAESLLIQALMIEQMVDAGQQQPELMPQVQAAVLAGARASGLDLAQMELTETGFVPR